jgi:hypothetical protein
MKAYSTGPTINTLNARNVYPTFPGATVGGTASAMSGYSGSEMAYPDDVSDVPDAIMNDQTDPATSAAFWVALAALMVGLMFTARKLGQESEFSNLRLSTYNIVVISLAAIVGISFWKVVFAKIQVPGLSRLIASV